MKNTVRIILPLALLFPVILGCSTLSKLKDGIASTEPQVISNAECACQVTVPAGWAKSTGLNDEAELQVSDRRNDVHAMVLSESLEDFADKYPIDKYLRLAQDAITEKIKNAAISAEIPVDINSLPARQFEVTGEVDGVKARYIYAIVMSKDKFYQVVTFTTASKFDKNRAAMSGVINSFKANAGAPPGSEKAFGEPGYDYKK